MGDKTAAGEGAVLALAGRRIDAQDADAPRFPIAQAQTVGRRLHDLLIAENAVALVSSAACGADLLALEAAGALGLRRRVVLPFAKAAFREISVVDRPGDWGALYDRILAEVESKGDLVVLPQSPDDDGAYEAANRTIVREAQNLDAPGERVAVVVWEGQPRSGADMTQSFRDLTAQAKFSQRVVLTL